MWGRKSRTGLRAACALRRSVRRSAVVVLVAMGLSAVIAASARAVIVYTCGENLCRINSDGSKPVRLTDDGAAGSGYSASLDPAGTRMVFEHGSSLYAADGSAQNTVGPISNTSSLAKISFDGSTGVDVENDTALGEGHRVCTFASASGFIRECGFNALFPTFAPSGELVASFTDAGTGQLVICEYRVGATFGAADPPTRASDPTGSLIEPAVSPDGRTVAVVVAPSADSPSGYIALYSMSTGQLVAQLTNGTADSNPAWSPHGTKIAFSRNGALYVTPSSGSPGEEKRIAAKGTNPTWGGPDVPAGDQVSGLKLASGSIRSGQPVAFDVTLSSAVKITVRLLRYVAATGAGRHRTKAHYEVVGTLTFAGRAGPNKLLVSKLDGHRLAVAKYEAQVSAGGAKHVVRFNVVH